MGETATPGTKTAAPAAASTAGGGPARPYEPGLSGNLIRGLARLIVRVLYRLSVIGAENIPATGGVLLAPNHVSFVDTLFLMAAVRRPIRFVIEQAWFDRWWLAPFVRALGCIPISAVGGPRQMIQALRDAGEGLSRGEVICIFPEGQLTRTGSLQTFRRGMTRLVKGRDAVIVPIYMDRVWGSIFSREGGRFLWKWPKRVPYPVTVAIGRPMPPESGVGAVRRAVQDLAADAWPLRKRDRTPLHRTAIRKLRRRAFSMAMADASRPYVPGRTVLAGAVAIARALRPEWDGQERVGILLPPSVGGALVNLAAAFAGKVVVNLNYTSGREGLASSARQAGLRHVVTSREFLEKAKVELPPGLEPLWIDDVRARIGFASRISALTIGMLAPAAVLERLCGTTRPRTIDDPATVIFSSGSTGEPKGIVLSQFNVDSNIEAGTQVIRPQADDRILGILPFFHSFGNYLLWFGLTQGTPIVFHASPLDVPVIGKLVEEHRVTFLLATPTFLQLYLRRVQPGQFGSVRLILAGAEKLPARLRDACRDTFGIEPLEGYGATECSPVVAVSVPDFRTTGFFQAGSRRGTVGQAIPGVTLRVVDPDTFEPRGIGEEGMLLVRGPNVMQGYLGRPDLTAKAIRDGWYVTGDIAIVDDQGYVRITDRLARFSKIGGEMVPHGRVEEALHDAANARGRQLFAVTAVPDVKKGERLAVIHVHDPGRIHDVLAKVSTMGLPNLYLPRFQDFVRVEALPVLGTGKLDLRAVRKVAEAALLCADHGTDAHPIDAPH